MLLASSSALANLSLEEDSVPSRATNGTAEALLECDRSVSTLKQAVTGTTQRGCGCTWQTGQKENLQVFIPSCHHSQTDKFRSPLRLVNLSFILIKVFMRKYTSLSGKYGEHTFCVSDCSCLLCGNLVKS